MLKLKVNAKINLSLDITGKKENGYHLLDMVMTSISLSDYMQVSLRSDNKINVEYDNNISFENDICKKAGNMLVSKYGFNGVDVKITKNIPEKSGLGGSSSDASGIIFAMAKLNNYDLKNIKTEDILSIGSDVLYMLYGGTRRVLGIGEKVGENIATNKLNFVLLTDKFGVDTIKSYKTYSYGYNRFNNDKLIENLQKGENKLGEYFKNALYDSSRLLNPEIDKKMEILQKIGVDASFMTGSGSGVLGYFSGEISKKTKESIEEICKDRYGIYYVTNLACGIEILT